MSQSDYVYEARADLPGVAFSTMREMILAQARTADLRVLEDAGGHLTIEMAQGLVGLRPGKAAETAGMVAARDAHRLFVMKNIVIHEMRHVLPEVADLMRWSDGDGTGKLPPNFQFVRIRDVVRLGSVFLRVTLEGEDLSAYGDDAIHFRLILPPAHVEPRWPSVAPNGSTDWPDGPGAPHKPVYTARYVDHRAQTLVTDVFMHEGGRTTAWVQEVMAGEPGRRVVGMMGPSGGGLLKADRTLMASDETGFPAAARLLDALPDGATGDILLEAETGEACGYPIAAPPGIRLHWLARSRGESLLQAALAALPDFAGAQVWFAGEREDARRLRDTAKAAGWTPADLRISSFWTSHR